VLIDRFAPRYDVRARYHVAVHAPPETAYSVARTLDFGDSRLVRWLYRLRGLPRDGLSLEGMFRWGFVVLAEEPGREFVVGLIGRFWTPSGRIQPVHADSFVAFRQPGFAKAVANFAVIPQGGGDVRVSTETRIHCLDATSRRRFRLYWLFIGPFSGLIRKEWLRLIKRRAEAPRDATSSGC
jgi:hypothetical protein